VPGAHIGQPIDVRTGQTRRFWEATRVVPIWSLPYHLRRELHPLLQDPGAAGSHPRLLSALNPAAPVYKHKPPTRSVSASVDRRALATLIGNLQFIAPVVHAGSTFLRSFYDALHGLHQPPGLRPSNYNCSVPLPDGFWLDFSSYEKVLAAHTGKRLMRGDWVSLTRTWTDASKHGLGYSTVDNDEDGRPLTQLQFLMGHWPKHLQLKSSNWRELRTILLTLQDAYQRQLETGVRALDGQVLYTFTDNAVSASVLNRGTSAAAELLEQVRAVRELEALMGCQLVAVWTPGSGTATSIVSQGTDGLSRDAPNEGAMAGDGTDPLAFSPIDNAAPPAEPALVAAVRDTLTYPGSSAQLLSDPRDWYQQPHPLQPTVLVPHPSLARQAIEQVLRWHASRPYTTGVAVILPNTYSAAWGRLSKNFTRAYFAAPGRFRRPRDAAGTFVVLYTLPHLDAAHASTVYLAGPADGQPLPDLQKYARHLDPALRCEPGDAHHPATAVLAAAGIKPPPQLPQELLRRHWPDTAHQRALTRVRAANAAPAAKPAAVPADDASTAAPAGAPAAAPPVPIAAARRGPTFPARAADLLERLCYFYLVASDIERAVTMLNSNLELECRPAWLRALHQRRCWARQGKHCYQKRRNLIHFFRLPYYLWSESAFGVVPSLAKWPAPYDQGNYVTSRHEAVYKEFDRLQSLGYVEGPITADKARVTIPLGAVPKKDTDAPRVIVDGTKCGLNSVTDLIRFKYPAFADYLDLIYPGAYVWKLDWTDAFFCSLLYQPCRSLFTFRHPRTDELFRYTVTPFGWSMSPFYYSRLVHAYVDLLRGNEHYDGTLVTNFANTPEHHGTLPKLYRTDGAGLVQSSCDQYCDDGIGFSRTEATGAASLRAATAHVHHLGATPKTTKTVAPTQTGAHVLGLAVDTSATAHDGSPAVQLGIPGDRLADLRVMMRSFRQRAQPGPLPQF
jgi:hypothetical protein